MESVVVLVPPSSVARPEIGVGIVIPAVSDALAFSELGLFALSHAVNTARQITAANRIINLFTINYLFF